MAVPHWPFFVATVQLFLLPHGLQCSPAHHPATACLGHRGVTVLNCSSSGLSLAPRHIQATVSELDLSHNNLLSLSALHQPRPNLKSVWLGHNGIRHLSLCVEGTAGGRRGPQRSGSQRRRGCVSWAPSLQLLSVERNLLVQLPEGLGGSESLQVLQLSYNRISSLQPGHLSALRQLRELHLQHNHITSLHPQALQNLSQLRVLDLSFNLLSTISPLTYLSLRTVTGGVELGGNRWRCDCSMQSVRRWMAYDTARGHHAWRVVCASPSALSGRDLLRLDEDYLTCSTADNWPGQHHQDITLDQGSEILLPCGTAHQVSTWWTPKGEVSLNQAQPGLLISNITETDTGLYVCVTESQRGSLAVFNLQIRKTESKTRNPRSVPRGLIPQDIIHRVGNGTTQSDLALAVSLSVIITFLVAFIIGVLVRPCIDILWRRMCTKKESSATYDVSAAGQRPYDNEAYSDGEESVEMEGHRERRVTFTTVDNVPYYDTVANQENASRDTVIGVGMAMTKDQSEEAGSVSSSQQGSPETKGRVGRDLQVVQDDPHLGPAHRMEFEHIQDPRDLGESGSLSSYSASSHSDKEQKVKLLMQKDPHAPQFPQQAEDPFQQRSSESHTTRPVGESQASIEGTGFTCEPFAEWTPNVNDQNLRDPDLWNDSGEKFDFSDSARSSSLFGSFNQSNQNVLSSSDKWKHSDNSSTSTCMSGDEPTQYTVNVEGEEEVHVEATQLTHDPKVEIVNPCLKQDASSKQQGYGEDPFRPSLRDEKLNQAECRLDTQSPSVGPERSDSSHSSDSDGEHTQYTVNQERKEEEKMQRMVSETDRPESNMPRTDLKPEAEQLGLSVETRAPSPPAAHPPSSSSESDAETVENPGQWDRTDMEISRRDPETTWPDTDLSAVSPGPIPAESSSSSSENEDERRYSEPKPEREAVPRPKETLVEVSLTPKRALNITLENSDAITEEVENGTKVEISPAQRVTPELESRWAGMTLGISRLRKHTGIASPKDASPKVPSTPLPESSSSSSESEDEHQHRGVKETNTVKKDSGDTLAALGVPRLKRRMDIKSPEKPPPPPPSQRPQVSSTSSEGEDEMGKGQRETPELYPKKALKVHFDQSGSSNVEQGETVELHFNSQSSQMEKETQSGLSSDFHIKRRLDIKTASPPQSKSSSSSESEDETSSQKKKHDGDRFDFGSKGPEPETKWPNLDFSTIPVLKRRLDIKAPSPPPGDSFSLSSKEEGADHTIKQGERDAGNVTSGQKDSSYLNVGGINVSLTPKRALNITLKNSADITDEAEGRTTADISPDQIVTPELESRWAGMTLGVSRLRKHTGIASSKDASPKVPSTPLPESSSSSSESEDEHQHRGVKETNTGTEYNSPRTEVKKDSGDVLAALGVPRLKRRMNIKSPEKPPPPPPSPRSHVSSSSSEGEDEMGKGQRETPELYPKKALKVHFDQSGGSNEEQGETAELHFSSQSSQVEKESKSGLSSDFHIKRRLDIKAASPPQSKSSSSSESEDETSSEKKKHDGDRFDFGSKGPEPEAKWPNLDFSTIPVLKRRLDIKAPSPPPGDSFSFSSKEEGADHTIKQGERDAGNLTSGQKDSYLNVGGINVSLTETAELHFSSQSSKVENESKSGLSSDFHIKRRLDIKAASPPQSKSSSSSESEDEPSSEKKKHEGKWPLLDLDRIPSLKRSLDIKAPSPPPGDSSPFRSKEESADHTIILGEREDGNLASKENDSHLNAGGIHVSLAQRKALNFSVDEMVRKRIEEIRPDPHVVFHPESRGTGFVHSKSTIGALEERHAVKSKVEKETQSGLSSDFHIKRRLDTKAASPLQSESSSSSESEDETSNEKKKHDGKWPLLDLDRIPSLKRSLDIKAPSPPPGDSSPFSRKEESADYAIILREREAGNVEKDSRLNAGGIDVSLAQRKALNISFDEMVRKRTEQIRPDPESRGTGFVHSKSVIAASEERHAVKSDPPASNLRRPLNVQPQQEAPPAVPGSRPPFTSSSSSDSEDDKKQEREKEQIPPANPYSSFGSTSASSQRPRGVLDIRFDNTSSSTDGIGGSVRSEDRRERKGLNALKAMSSERENWDTAHEESVDFGPQTDQIVSYHGHTTFKYQTIRDFKPFVSSTSTDGTRAAGMPCGISQLSGHTVVDTRPPQEAPPPVPGSPPPEEDGVAVPMWRSPKISEKQDWAYMGSMSSASRNSDVERSPSLIGLGVATPYRTTRGYRSITSTTTQLVQTDKQKSNVTTTTSKTSTLHFDHSNSITDV